MQDVFAHHSQMTSSPTGRSDSSRAELKLGILRNDVGFQVHLTRRAIWNALRGSKREDVPREPSGFYSCLIVIGANPGISQTQLADALFMDLSNLTQLLGDMLERKLVERAPDPRDRRRFLLTLTDEGTARLTDALAFNQSQRMVFSQALQDDEIEQLTGLLRKLQTFLKHTGEKR